MNYGYTELATDWNEKEMNSFSSRIICALLFFIPKGNPDNEKLYPFVSKWFIEIDENGIPCREIGIDSKGAPLFAAPDTKNYGFWTDSNQTFKISDLQPANKEEFNSMWFSIVKNA